MKLRVRFFCAAYAVVLLLTGTLGILLVRRMTGMLRSAREQQMETAETYAVGSFLSLLDFTTQTSGAALRHTAERQISAGLPDCIEAFAVLAADETDKEFMPTADNEGMRHFVRDGGQVWLESICRVSRGETYYLVLTSNFTAVEADCRRLWWLYALGVSGAAVVSGLLLYILTRRVTAPLTRLTAAAESIAGGHYGETVTVGNADDELKTLADSFNTMSVAVRCKMEEILEEAEKRDAFVAGFSHEIKTPMTAIIGYAEMLCAYRLDEQETRQAAGAIRLESKRLERLAHQMLELQLFRNEDVALRPVCLSALQDQVTATLTKAAQKYGVTVQVTLPAVTVSAEPTLLMSLLYNLADNAFKASHAGQTVTLEAVCAETAVTVTVRDHGRGIAAESLPHLTEAFWREDKARSRALGGAGLGLTLCQKIAALHGTKLHFESRQGEGTAVSFVLCRCEVTP